MIDSSSGGDPLVYLHGAGNIIAGLENELAGCEEGAQKNVVVQPEDGYGVSRPELIQKLPRDLFTGIEVIEEGMEFSAQGPDGQQQPVVVKLVEDDGITIDANHALAGVVLNFDVTIEGVREATEEEVAHGHAH